MRKEKLRQICIYSSGALAPNFLSRKWTGNGFSRNTSDNAKSTFKSTVWKKRWSWTLVNIFVFLVVTWIVLIRNPTDNFDWYCLWKAVGTKDAIRIISSLNVSRKLLVSTVLRLVNPFQSSVAFHIENPQACNFIKKETLAQVFSCKFCRISKNTSGQLLWKV